VTRLARVIRIIRTTRWSWRSPRRGAVLVFDCYASDPITQLLAPGSYDVFDNHFEVINVPIALRTLVTGGRSWYDYCRRFVAAARPRLLVSAIDSNAHLYTFKHVSPSTQIVVVQNGIRGTGAPVPSGDLWTTLRRDFPDHLRHSRNRQREKQLDRIADNRRRRSPRARRLHLAVLGARSRRHLRGGPISVDIDVPR